MHFGRTGSHDAAARSRDLTHNAALVAAGPVTVLVFPVAALGVLRSGARRPVEPPEPVMEKTA
ncbi:MAG: hypothetical protein ACRDJ5_09510 [Actinomycetota bacterium]